MRAFRCLGRESTYLCVVKPLPGTRTAAVLGFVGVLVLLAWSGAQAWWSAGESADQGSWIAVQRQTSWVADHLRATPADVLEPCSQSLKLGARTWRSDRPATGP